jgi:signal transduction histidine kinase/Na+/proline symporter
MIILFTIALGFRRLEQTERHPGMVIVVAIQSVVKLVAFLVSGIFVTYFLFHGFGDIFSQIKENAILVKTVDAATPSYSLFLSYIIVSMSAILLLPRQFHLAVVESVNEKHIRTAAWALPLYLLLITLFVFPIAMAGVLKGYDLNLSDIFILLITSLSQHVWLTMLVFIGGISAAFSMIMVSTVAITTMVANNVVVPIVDRIELFAFLRKRLLPLRWAIAVVVLLLGFLFELAVGSSYVLVKIGIISFVAVLQFAPALIGGLYWEKGSKKGAILGMLGGFAIWAYTSMVPALVRSGWISMSLLSDGPFGIRFLRPEHLFGVTAIDPLAVTIIFTIIFNAGLYVVGSLFFKQSEEEKRIAYNFVNITRGGRYILPDISQKAYIDLNAKRTIIVSIFGKYMDLAEAEREADECIKKAGIGIKKVISIDVLIELSNIVESSLAAFIGSPAAHDDLRREHLFSPEEAAQLTNIYSKIAEDLKITPEEFIKKLAEQKALAESKSNFIAIASHEMRTPLTVIRGNAELLLEAIPKIPENFDTIKFLSGIQNNSVRLLDILHDFIDVVQLEENKIELKKEAFDLVALVREVASDLTGVVAEKKLYLRVEEPSGPLPMVVADAGKTRQVIVNLIGNATHYTSTGGITISVTRVFEREKDMLKVSVSDTGIGISTEGQVQLFHRFSTVQKTFLRTKEYGSGLGLYISKMFIESMGGSIKLEKSVLNEGSTFSVSLPVVIH